jgi:hypothetical protein
LSLHLPEAPQGWRPFAPVLHLQQHELGRSLHLRTKLRVSPTPIVNHSSLRSGHPSTTGTLLVLIQATSTFQSMRGGATKLGLLFLHPLPLLWICPRLLICLWIWTCISCCGVICFHVLTEFCAYVMSVVSDGCILWRWCDYSNIVIIC